MNLKNMQDDFCNAREAAMKEIQQLRNALDKLEYSYICESPTILDLLMIKESTDEIRQNIFPAIKDNTFVNKWIDNIEMV